jgi:hypothetical protein
MRRAYILADVSRCDGWGVEHCHDCARRLQKAIDASRPSVWFPHMFPPVFRATCQFKIMAHTDGPVGEAHG